ncbi:hypothetical protein JTY90_08775, partial [Klebsiella michiganensis]|uniref:hypothetical protein n=1 Tax=Klebsiella michiganensis TaxID=1134687 RepID=UPI001958DBD7
LLAVTYAVFFFCSEPPPLGTCTSLFGGSVGCVKETGVTVALNARRRQELRMHRWRHPGNTIENRQLS